MEAFELRCAVNVDLEKKMKAEGASASTSTAATAEVERLNATVTQLNEKLLASAATIQV
jgi:hypothetical protein